MTPGESAGVTPTLTARDLVSAVQGLDALADFHAETLTQKGSANLTVQLMRDLHAKVCACDADAVVVTQGTDSMEESSFIFSLINQSDKPVVFTGAMRSANLPSADGAANLYDAALVATDPAMRGVAVVMNGEVHDPWHVAKEHTSTLQAFQSEAGPVARVVEQTVHWNRGLAAWQGGVNGAEFAPVALVSAVLDDDARMLDALPGLGYQGVVIEAFGAGHLSEVWADKAEALAHKMPVVLASRAKGGRVFERTYGYMGAEIDLIARGLVPSGGLRSRKARLLLSFLLGQEVTNWKQAFTAAVKSV